MKINTQLDFQGNEIKLTAPEKVTTLPDSNLFIGRTCVLIEEEENVGSIYYYDGEEWRNIEGESLKIDETKINVIDNEITLHTFDTLSDTETYIKSNNKPKSVIIGSNAGITSISEDAFQSCKSLTSIIIPNSVTSIGEGAFSTCESLTSITIPDSVTSIGVYAFDSCISLKSINMSHSVTSISDGAFYGCTSLTHIGIRSSVTSIGDSAFYGCTSLTHISINTSVTSIGDSAFYGCTSLTSITIPYSVTSIGNNAFDSCTSLKSIGISDGVTSIGSNAFSGCKSITSITMPYNNITIDSTAFTGCDILSLNSYKSKTGYPWGATDIFIKNEDVTTTIDENSTDREVPTAKTVYDALSSSSSSLDDTKINVMCEGDPELYTFTTIANATTFIKSTDLSKHVVIGSNAGITTISSYAFSGCKSLKSITIPNTVTSIGGEAVFKDCKSLTSITIPNSVTSIGIYTFDACTSLTSITIPNSVTSIGVNAFDGCASLKSITIPNTVTSIGNYAFRNCTSLTSINISNVTIIGAYTFYGCTSLKSITIPNTVTSIANNTFNHCTSLKSITIPNTVTSIANNAFIGCDIMALEPYKERTGYPWGATDIFIQNEDVTTTIDENSTDREVPTAKSVYEALSSSGGGSSLDETKINVIDDEITLHTFDTLSDAVTYIESNNKPKSVIIGSNAGITSIGEDAFSYCTSLTSITIPDSVTSIGDGAFQICKSLTSIIIPDSVTSIGHGAFEDCSSLTSITIPDNVTSIGRGTFSSCTSLTFIEIPGNVTSIGSSAFFDCTSLTSINIPDSVTSIGEYAFENCTSLIDINIPDSVTSIANNAFIGCDIMALEPYKERTGYPWGATDIFIKNEFITTTINQYSIDREIPTAKSVYNFISENIFSLKFDMDYIKDYIERGLTEITIPYGVTSIGDYAFSGCTSLTSITIPDSVTSIGDSVFSGCTSLTSISIPSSVTSIGNYAFVHTSLTSITINKPNGSISGAPWGATNATVTWTG